MEYGVVPGSESSFVKYVGTRHLEQVRDNDSQDDALAIPPDAHKLHNEAPAHISSWTRWHRKLRPIQAFRVDNSFGTTDCSPLQRRPSITLSVDIWSHCKSEASCIVSLSEKAGSLLPAAPRPSATGVHARRSRTGGTESRNFDGDLVCAVMGQLGIISNQALWRVTAIVGSDLVVLFNAMGSDSSSS
ncbi:hypothetical protein JX265_003993 [Neoarthrinium moseri]|uniref:Uncharacterized protein n=1 Tax=Neoarthrinium moseri TaxID=1658444 RepID=A0A9P9WRX0_9PEZI|nr:hypothetical protein JX265_003993 [Neoarthrinium moseri]